MNYQKDLKCFFLHHNKIFSVKKRSRAANTLLASATRVFDTYYFQAYAKLISLKLSDSIKIIKLL